MKTIARITKIRTRQWEITWLSEGSEKSYSTGLINALERVLARYRQQKPGDDFIIYLSPVEPVEPVKKE